MFGDLMSKLEWCLGRRMNKLVGSKEPYLDMLLVSYCGISCAPEVWFMPGDGSGLCVRPLIDGMF